MVFLSACRRIKACVHLPETPMTVNVETTVMVIYAKRADRKISNTSMSPTAAGINISGMISIKNVLVSLIDATRMHFVCKHVKSKTIP